MPMPTPPPVLARLAGAWLAAAPALGVAAPDPASSGRASGYDLPPPAILSVLHAPNPPVPLVSPTGADLVLATSELYPPLSIVAEPYLRLAGVRVEPRTRRKHDTPSGYGVNTCVTSMVLVHVADGRETPVALPPGGCPTAPRWSADGRRFAFTSAAQDAVELWLGDAATGATHRVDGVRLNPMLGDSTLQWMPDQRRLLVKLVPADAGPPPPARAADEGPGIQQSLGQTGESSTYETRDTLSSRHDEDLFDYYATAQLALVDAASGRITPIGPPGIYTTLQPAPDDRHLLVERVHKPYSYVTTFERFPRTVQVWSDQGTVEHAVAELPPADRVPVHGVPVGPREFSWQQTAPATLVWAEALDGGDWKQTVPYRDRVLVQPAPFTAPPTELARLEQRYDGLRWSADPGLALLDDDDQNRHWRRTLVIHPNRPGAGREVLFDLSSDEQYANPGAPVMRTRPDGTEVLAQDGQAIFLAGPGATPGGDRPFLDRLDLATRQGERLFRSRPTELDRFLAFAPDGSGQYLTWHQSPLDPPNAYRRALGARPAGDPAPGEAMRASDGVAITHIPDPTPEVRGIHKTLVRYRRADGVELSFTLYTPPGYRPGTRVPAILNAYPLDYADPAKAGQVTGSEQTFTRLLQYRLLLLAGYAVIDRASFPIVGDPKRAYDTYLEQLVADARAAVDKAVDMGVVDPERIGVTGHSHGALMTVNLLAHSDLFRAGVATSGSYNKTLTPFGFQNERRSVWEAPAVYQAVSPFFSADKLKRPLLIMHGAEDANPGTTPLQATKLYEAVRGNGGTVRLVMLPHEPHWYTAMESNEQELYEMVQWFDRYVKNAPPRTAGPADAPAHGPS